jgi:ABC-type phosphate transport system auxiliary subunit
MKYVRGFFRFWYDFIVGDDWRLAVSLIAVIGIAALLAAAGVSAWWFTPPAIVAALAASLRRAVGDS